MICLGLLILRSLARNNSLGFEYTKCSTVDWVISAIFVIAMVLMVIVSTKLSAME